MIALSVLFIQEEQLRFVVRQTSIPRVDEPLYWEPFSMALPLRLHLVRARHFRIKFKFGSSVINNIINILCLVTFGNVLR